MHEIFQTDTADYADILLPATTQLEQLDIHKSYGHLYALANNPAIAPLGEALPNTEVFRRLAAQHGLRRAVLPRQRRATRAAGVQAERSARARSRLGHAASATAGSGSTFPRRTRRSRKATFRRRRASASSGRETLRARRATIRCRRCCCRANRRRANPALAARYPLAFISPPARNFLNSSFANLPAFVAEEKTPRLEIHPDDAAPRGIATGDRVRIFNDRGAFRATARVTDRARPGVVVAPSIWWRKLAPGGENANAVTRQALTDLGRAATFYDCLVEVERSLSSPSAAVEAEARGGYASSLRGAVSDERVRRTGRTAGQAVYTKGVLAAYDFDRARRLEPVRVEVSYAHGSKPSTPGTSPQVIWTSAWAPVTFSIIVAFRRPRRASR